MKLKYNRTLHKYDKDTFLERLERLNWLNSIFPKGYGMLSQPETSFLFSEAKMTLINGEYISTILLSASFIEHWLQSELLSKGFEKESKKGLKYIVKFMKENNMLHEYLARKINELREFRNPFVHLKELDNPNTIMNIVIKEKRDILSVIENKAKFAISLMYEISITKFN